MAGGWSLEEYDWDPDTGIATLVYERFNHATELTERFEMHSAQPNNPKHTGWNAQRAVQQWAGRPVSLPCPMRVLYGR